MKISISMTLSLVMLIAVVSPTIVKRCCPAGYIWDSEQSTCNQGDDSALSSLTNIKLEDNRSEQLPCARTDLEIFKILSDGNSVSAEGHLVTSKYGLSANVTHFCVSASQTGDLIAVTCNLCRQNEVGNK